MEHSRTKCLINYLVLLLRYMQGDKVTDNRAALYDMAKVFYCRYERERERERERECCETTFVHRMYVLLSLANRVADWPMVRQDFGSRENTVKIKDGV